MARKLLGPALTMQHKPTDNLTGYVRELASRIKSTENEAELTEVVGAAVSEIRECVNVERLAAASRMAGWLAHQINNPLGAISGSAQLLSRRLQRDISDQDALETYMRYTEAVQCQAERCARITGEILDFNKTREPQVRRVDVMQAVNEAVETALYGRGDIDLAISPVESDEPLIVQTDGELLTRVIYEVIVNAIQATSEGQSIMVGAGLAQRAERVRIAVSDGGEGIPEDVLPRVFEPFFSTREKARGLGLTTSLSIMQQLGGTINIEETGQTGTTVWIELPARRTSS